MTDPPLGSAVADRAGRTIGRVDAAFADYLLVRTVGLLPVDLYIPVSAVVAGEDHRLNADVADAREAYGLWHRPLKRAPHA